MGKVSVEFTIRMNEPFVFEGAPPTREEPIRFSFSEPSAQANLFVDPSDDYLALTVNEVKLLREDSTPCKVLRLSLEILASNAVETDLRRGERNADTAVWGEVVLSTFLRVASSIFDYARNIKKQFWLTPIERDTTDGIDEELRRWDTKLNHRWPCDRP